MKKSLLSMLSAAIILTAALSGGILAWSAPRPAKEAGVLLPTMQAELERAKTSLAKSDPAALFHQL